ncbi:DUF4058 family protein [Roseofilum casamattae]|uniref:DUF4058 family protein n=1 Tax=Roseofilum casamattae BLCC-M143 TaxID=3022442 RepID=A0ABT7BWQ7_9CYAN|nr:DUF4058 family protein [Roseofilum casamattae]MDJ1183629.1 DUF4058 family protein [Roseofilum casamattae BLCC-M143]
MPSPFPGMNPYLEHPDLWSEVHSRLIVALADEIAPRSMPNYYVALEKRIYLSTPQDSVLIGIPYVSIIAPEVRSSQDLERNPTSTATLPKPDEPQTVTVALAEEVQERYLEIRETNTGRVVTAIELLSPKNKRAGEGKEAYLRKRQRILTSSTHLVEIDLLRGGKPMPMQGVTKRKDYRILMSRSDRRPYAQLYSFNLTDAIPKVELPLQAEECSLVVDLKPILDGIYDRGGYHFRIDYSQPTIPALSGETAAWANTVLYARE